MLDRQWEGGVMQVGCLLRLDSFLDFANSSSSRSDAIKAPARNVG